MTQDIEQIAAGLSEDQQDCILNCEERGNGAYPYTLHSLRKLGIMSMQEAKFGNMLWRVLRLSPLGLSVRAHLQKQESGS